MHSTHKSIFLSAFNSNSIFCLLTSFSLSHTISFTVFSVLSSVFHSVLTLSPFIFHSVSFYLSISLCLSQHSFSFYLPLFFSIYIDSRLLYLFLSCNLPLPLSVFDSFSLSLFLSLSSLLFLSFSAFTLSLCISIFYSLPFSLSLFLIFNLSLPLSLTSHSLSFVSNQFHSIFIHFFLLLILFMNVIPNQLTFEYIDVFKLILYYLLSKLLRLLGRTSVCANGTYIQMLLISLELHIK